MIGSTNTDDKITYEDMQITEKNMHIHLGYMRRDLADIKRNMCKNYVTKEEFRPIKTVVYGLISLIGVGIVGLITRSIIIVFSMKGGG